MCYFPRVIDVLPSSVLLVHWRNILFERGSRPYACCNEYYNEATINESILPKSLLLVQMTTCTAVTGPKMFLVLIKHPSRVVYSYTESLREDLCQKVFFCPLCSLFISTPIWIIPDPWPSAVLFSCINYNWDCVFILIWETWLWRIRAERFRPPPAFFVRRSDEIPTFFESSNNV